MNCPSCGGYVPSQEASCASCQRDRPLADPLSALDSRRIPRHSEAPLVILLVVVGVALIGFWFWGRAPDAPVPSPAPVRSVQVAPSTSLSPPPQASPSPPPQASPAKSGARPKPTRVAAARPPDRHVVVVAPRPSEPSRPEVVVEPAPASTQASRDTPLDGGVPVAARGQSDVPPAYAPGPAAKSKPGATAPASGPTGLVAVVAYLEMEGSHVIVTTVVFNWTPYTYILGPTNFAYRFSTGTYAIPVTWGAGDDAHYDGLPPGEAAYYYPSFRIEYAAGVPGMEQKPNTEGAVLEFRPKGLPVVNLKVETGTTSLGPFSSLSQDTQEKIYWELSHLESSKHLHWWGGSNNLPGR